MRATAMMLIVVLFLLEPVRPCHAQISKEDYNRLRNEYLDVLKKTDSVRESTFWERHKWKVITAAVLVVGGAAIILSGGLAAPATAVATGGFATKAALMSSVAFSSAAATSTGVAVITGIGITAAAVGTIGGAVFLGGKVVSYLLQSGIAIDEEDKRAMIRAINEKEADIINSAKTEDEALKMIDQIALEALKSRRK